MERRRKGGKQYGMKGSEEVRILMCLWSSLSF